MDLAGPRAFSEARVSGLQPWLSPSRRACPSSDDFRVAVSVYGERRLNVNPIVDRVQSLAESYDGMAVHAGLWYSLGFARTRGRKN